MLASSTVCKARAGVAAVMHTRSINIRQAAVMLSRISNLQHLCDYCEEYLKVNYLHKINFYVIYFVFIEK